MIDEAIRKAAVLIESLPYIRKFRGKTVVVKFGGAAMDRPEILDSVLRDVVYMETVGMRPVLVHGGGPAISAAMEERGKEPVFVQGLRVTDAEALEIVREVLANGINADICRRLEASSAHPAPVAEGGDGALRARRKTATVENEQGEKAEVSLGFVGDMVGVDVERFGALIEAGRIPVVTPLATGPEGETLNVNGDSAAGFLAGALGAEKIVFLSDTHGIRRDPDDPDSFAPTLTEIEIRDMIDGGVIGGGMLPKVAAAIAALDKGVPKAHIVDGRIRHSLLLEIFTDRGIGTEIVK